MQTMPHDLRSAYITLLSKSLTFTLWEARDSTLKSAGEPKLRWLAAKLAGRRPSPPPDNELREDGRDWPRLALTMIGQKRMDSLQACVEDVLNSGVPGDLIETGVWRGGATILMRGILKAYGVTDRRVWVADSFAGLPPPNPTAYPADAGDTLYQFSELAIPLEEVKASFERYGLLDQQVCFLKGWFKDTLPAAPMTSLAVIRLDGDMYESTMDGLTHLYPKLSVGGYLIVDDYGAMQSCQQAVADYRREHGIEDEIHQIDWTGVYWKKTHGTPR